jgi:hypothetical protein
MGAGPVSDCTDFAKCFEIDYSPAGVALSPAIDPSIENGLKCIHGAQHGLWDPDEKVAVFCKKIHGFISGSFNESTNITLPIFNTFTITNPSPTMNAMVYWAWYVESITLEVDGGTRGTVITAGQNFPNPPIDISYAVFAGSWPGVRSQIIMAGPSAGYGDCPLLLPPGASATKYWEYRFEGSGSPGGWRAGIQSLYASALVVTVPN